MIWNLTHGRYWPSVIRARRRLALRWAHLARTLRMHGDEDAAIDALTVALLLRDSVRLRLAKRSRSEQEGGAPLA